MPAMKELSTCTESLDELGDKSTKKLAVIEVMGRHSNIILVDQQRKDNWCDKACKDQIYNRI